MPKIPIGEKESVGLVGAYTIREIPMPIQLEISQGLTLISEDGTAKPGLAKGWKIQNEGKVYEFYLKDNLRFTDGSKFTSDAIDYFFSNVEIKRTNSSTIAFRLKESYSPFLITASQPIFKKGFVGIGRYKVKDMKLNGEFVKSIKLIFADNPLKTKTYYFYPSQEALKIAFALGEVSQAVGLSDTNFQDTSFQSFKNVKVLRRTNYQRIVTLFYNTKDSVFSDPKLRNALTYTIPDKFKEGERNYSPFSYNSWAYTKGVNERKQDIVRTREFLSQSQTATKSGELTISLKTLQRYENTAKEIMSVWKTVGIDTKIEVVENVPETFQVFLGDFRVPRDPDQYVLWHKDQENNITRYNNLRIDKLLEDGRKTVDLEERKQIYVDFEKYLLADSPASFLYSPYEYEVTRK